MRGVVRKDGSPFLFVKRADHSLMIDHFETADTLQEDRLHTEGPASRLTPLRKVLGNLVPPLL